MDYTQLLQQARQYITDYFATQVPRQLPYHNLNHTERVVAAVVQIGNHYQLNEADFAAITAAAWFHDMGYYTGPPAEHEQNGATMAEQFLREKGCTSEWIAVVKKCIMATQMPQQPVTLLEKIVCDGDLFHLGTKEFKSMNKLMRQEMEERKGHAIDKKDWRRNTIALLQAHHYQTDYCQLLLNEQKQENLAALIKKQGDDDVVEQAKSSPAPPAANEKPATNGSGEPKNKKAERPVRGIETMFRVASTNHQRLSDMADSKAHIMISVNSIILSVVIGLMARKLDDTNHSLIVATLILLSGSVIAVIFSVLATRPKIPNGYFTPEQLAKKSVNLLFFGNFYKMDYDHYYEGMKEVMADSDFLYASLIRDIHSQGIVLGHKYRLLRISYTVFMFTLIVSVIAFGIAFIFFG